jgi:hypothetical protein
MNIDLREVEWFGLVSELMGMVLVVLGIFWDEIAGIQIQHSAGLGWMQILWIAFWGLYSFWAWHINKTWGEYNKHIRGIGGCDQPYNSL